MTSPGENAVLDKILEKVSEANIALARLEQNLTNQVARINKMDVDMRTFAVTVERHALALQRLELDATAAKATVEVTAKALREAEEARRDKTEQSWSPVARLNLVLGVFVALVTIGTGMYLIFHK